MAIFFQKNKKREQCTEGIRKRFQRRCLSSVLFFVFAFFLFSSTANVDASAIVTQELIFTYTTGTTPAVGHNDIYSSYLVNGILYVDTRGGGLSVIDTHNTASPTDDTLLITYTTGTTPAIASNTVRHSHLEDSLLYVGTSSGLSVINTQNTSSPADDICLITYNTGSTPAIGGSSIWYSHLEGGLLYVGTETGGLSVIDTHNTPSPTDDTLFVTYNTTSTPAIISNNVTSFRLTGGLIYVSTSGGLSVIDTKNTQSPADDTLLITYTTTSTPAIGGNTVASSYLENGLLYVDTRGGGLSVIDTHNTASPTDDTLLITYTTGTTPAIASNTVWHSDLVNGILYISTQDAGLSVVDIENTKDPTDDTLLTTYNTTSTPALGNNYIYSSQITNDLLYVSVRGGGLAVISAVIDTTSPAITLNSLTTPTNNPILAGSVVEETDTVVSVEYKLDSGSWTSCIADDGAFDEANETFTCDSGSPNEGQHTIYVRSTDSNSNTTQEGNYASASFTFDSTDPTKNISEIKFTKTRSSDFQKPISKEKRNYTQARSPKLSGTNGDAANGTVTIFERTKNNRMERIGTASIESDGKWSFEIPERKDGTKRYAVKFTDQAGNISGSSSAFYIVRDRKKPDFTASLPESLQRNQTVTFTAEDTISGMNFYKVSFVGKGQNQHWLKQKTDTFTVPKNLPNGTYLFTVRAFDKAGNVREVRKEYRVW